jgi:hypothetical protein
MADLSDVSATLVQLVASIVYPQGVNAPSIAGVPVKVFEGWPLPAQLDADLAAGACQVSVYPQPGGETLTTRYLNDGESVLSINTATLSLIVGGQTVTLTGTAPTPENPQVLMVVVNGQAYDHAVSVSETLPQAMAALGAKVAADVPGTVVAGPVMTLPDGARLTAARVAVTGTYSEDVRRQSRSFQITIWAPDPAKRTALAKPIDIALAKAKFLQLPDQKARMLYKSTGVMDNAQKDGLYRRDLIYSVEYATTEITTTTTVASQTVAITPQDQTAPPFTQTLHF